MNKNQYTDLYQSHDSSFLINWAGKTIRPIRISLPSPPPLHLIDGYGLNPEQQVFRPLDIPDRLLKLEQSVKKEFSDKERGASACKILNRFWDLLESRKEDYKDEIEFIKKVIYYMYEGYWCFIDGKPTYITGWYFSYLNFNNMTKKVGFGLPDYREDSRLRWLFREYLYKTTETFADLDPKTGKAIKVADENGSKYYRMVDTKKKLFVGTIEPKGRRKGLTNEYCHILIRLAMANRGNDKLCTIVSMGGENAETHFKRKLLPAFNNMPLWIKPIYKGGLILQGTQIDFSSKDYSEIGYLGTVINYTESGGDLANDGKMLIGGGFDEQGKGKRHGNVQNRWHVNREAMSLGAGEGIVGFCVHPSTVEEMSEGGQDYKDMCDLSDFYTRTANGQTQSGLGLIFLPDDFCLEFYTDKFGNAVYDDPTPRQIRLGFNKNIGSKKYIGNTRNSLYDPNNPAKMVAYRSHVRKHPILYEECWTGIAGQLGLPNELLRKRKTELEVKPETVTGEFIWISRQKLIVDFVESASGRWTVAKIMQPNESCRVTTMEHFSAVEKEDVLMNRPAGRVEAIVGIDSHQFSNKSEARFIEAKNTKKSETGITVLQRRNKNIDVNPDPKTWTTQKFIATFQSRLDTSAEQADEALKAAIYYNGLINIEINRREVWEELIKQRMGGYLNYKLELLANGEPKLSYTPGTSITGSNKSTGFNLLSDHYNYYWKIEPIYELIRDCDEISSMEELTKYDRIASALQALFGNQNLYPDFMSGEFDEEEMEGGFVLGAESFRA